MVTRTRTSRAQITLARALSKLGVASRSQARGLVVSGKVIVNDHEVRNPELWLDPREDTITIEGNAVHAPGFIYLAMHKPRGVVTSRSDERGRPTVYELLPPGLPVLFPVGRLDRESSGLLLFTNDTRFGDRITKPAGETPKTYRVVLDRRLAGADAAAMRRGMKLADGTSLRPALVEAERTPGPGLRGHQGPAACRITITEGKNRQIRRMCEAMGYEVRSLHRLSIGPVDLGTLAEGAVRALTPEEVSGLSAAPVFQERRHPHVHPRFQNR